VKRKKGGILEKGSILGPIGLITAIAILLWKVTPEIADKFWQFWYIELPEMLAEKIKPVMVAMLDLVSGILRVY